MVKRVVLAVVLMILSSWSGLRVLKGHLGQTPDEARITYKCTFIIMHVVYSMLKKCWNTCPYIRRKTNVYICMNKCVLLNIGSNGRIFASEGDIKSYIKQSPPRHSWQGALWWRSKTSLLLAAPDLTLITGRRRTYTTFSSRSGLCITWEWLASS